MRLDSARHAIISSPQHRRGRAGVALMAWVKLDDQFARHPKVLSAGPLAGWLYIAGLCYANGYLTDGFIPLAAVRTLADFTHISTETASIGDFGSIMDEANPEALACHLVACGLWEEVDSGFLIHDYLDYNPAAESVRTARAARAEAGRVGGQRSGSTRRTPTPTSNEADAEQTRSKPQAKTKQTPEQTTGKNEVKGNPVPDPVPDPQPVPRSEQDRARDHDAGTSRTRDADGFDRATEGIGAKRNADLDAHATPGATPLDRLIAVVTSLHEPPRLAEHTTLREIRTLSPPVAEDEFTSALRDALARPNARSPLRYAYGLLKTTRLKGSLDGHES